MAAVRQTVVDAVAAGLWHSGRSRPARRARGTLTIVTFHRVLPAAERAAYPYPGLVVTPDELGGVLDYLSAHYCIDPVSTAWAALCDGVPSDRPRLSVTFDDGQWDNVAYAGPVLAERAVAATFYIPVDAVETGALLWHDELGYALGDLTRGEQDERVRAASVDHGLTLGPGGLDTLQVVEAAKALDPDGRRAFVDAISGTTEQRAPEWGRLMHWDEVRALHGAGHEIGSHSMSHALLPQLTDDAQADEIGRSKRALEEVLQAPVSSFCYPNGDHDERARKVTAASGYANAVTTSWGVNPPDADPFALARCDVDIHRFVDRRGQLSPARAAMRLGGLQPGLVGR